MEGEDEESNFDDGFQAEELFNELVTGDAEQPEAVVNKPDSTEAEVSTDDSQQDATVEKSEVKTEAEAKTVASQASDYQDLDVVYDEKLADLVDKFDDGTLEQKEFELGKAKIARDYNAQKAEVDRSNQEWHTVQSQFFAENPDFYDPVAFRELSHVLNDLAKDPAHNDKTSAQLLHLAAEKAENNLNELATKRLNKVNPNVQKAADLTAKRKEALARNVAISGKPSTSTKKPSGFDAGFNS